MDVGGAWVAFVVIVWLVATQFAVAAALSCFRDDFGGVFPLFWRGGISLKPAVF